MTGRIFLLFIFVFISQFSVAQKEDRNWVFGDSCGIDFNNIASPNFFLTNCYNYEANCSISDKNGNLNMYMTAVDFMLGDFKYCRVINGQNNMMENGDSIIQANSATNGAFFIPFPNDSAKYYFFSIGNLLPQEDKLYYSVIDLNYNAGLGKVVTKNNFMIDSTTEHLTAVRHGNGRDWWIITHKLMSTTFVKYLLSSNGIAGPFYQDIGSEFYRQEGECSTSTSGNKIAFIGFNGNIDVFDFDRCNGNFTNWLELGSPPYNIPNAQGWGYYGCEFSVSGNEFYVSRFKNSFPFFTNIFQYSLDNANPVNTKVDILPQTQGFLLAQLQKGPNDKIYIAGHGGPGILDSSYKYLSVINNPDDSGAACNLDLFSFYLGGNYTMSGLPNMPNYNLGKLVGSACDTLTSIQNENLITKSLIRIFPNPATEQLTIEVLRQAQHDNNEIEIEITDVMGRLIHKEQSHSHLSIIHCQLFSAGIYFVKVYMNDGSVEVKKFVKE